MRCPKCHYISFDSNDRCRNCGYEFSLAAEAPIQPLDLPIQTGQEAIGPLADFSLSDLDTRRGNTPAPPPRAPAPDPPPAGRPRAAVPQPRPITSTFDLPLFKDRRIDEDAPLVTAPAVPRPPIAVRRSNPNPLASRGNGRSPADEPVLDLESSEPYEPAARFTPRVIGVAEAVEAAPAEGPAPAAAGPRLFAALVDAVILASVDAVVLYFTLKVCRLQPAELLLLPPIPFAAFLALLAGGYFILFTVAGGQTIGKMAAGIRVVAADGDGHWSGRVPLGRAVLRAVGYLVSLLPVGLGFLPALVGADRRAVHDRLADTRVVKA